MSRIALPDIPLFAEHAARWSSLQWECLRPGALCAADNLALEEVLVSSVAAGKRGPSIRIWDWTETCAVLGRFQSVRNEIDVVAANRQGIGVVRRMTGGGTMFIEPGGAITYSVYAPESLVKDLDFIQSYEFFDSWTVAALRGIGIDIWYRPVNDIASAHGKIAGAAQARRGGIVLHHTTMAYRMNIPLMLSVLRTGKDRISKKGIASANKIVGPLSMLTSHSREEIIKVMLESFEVNFGLSAGAVSEEEMTSARELATAKYASGAWTFVVP